MKIELLVDGRKIPMNEFVQKIIGNVIKAMVETLHTVDGEWKEISLHVENEEIKEWKKNEKKIGKEKNTKNKIFSDISLMIFSRYL